MKIGLFIGFLVFNLLSFAGFQAYVEIEGRIIDRNTKEPIAFTKIYNKSLNNGSISNENGYFRIQIKSYSDTVYVNCMGYHKKELNLKSGVNYYTVYLDQEDRLLSAVQVSTSDNDPLYELIYQCHKNTFSQHQSAKAYYELKSYIDTIQTELVEGFYNVDLIGYDIDYLNLKAGRLAVKTHQNRFFASFESSRAITQMKTLNKNSYFPTSPLELKKRELKKAFYVNLESKYVSEEKDSIYELKFKPKDKNGNFYSGRIWINSNQKTVLKVNLVCDSCKKHPFLPIFPSDTLANVSLNITKTFTSQNGKMHFNHVDFIYEIDYKSRAGTPTESRYKIKTKAVLFAYDFEKLFEIPTEEFIPQRATDYRKFNALPYNDFFWKYNDEYRIHNQTNKNEQFFNDTNSITNKTVFKNLLNYKFGLYEHPFIIWNGNRVLFKEFIDDTIVSPRNTGVITEKYNLKVNFYVDINA